jgi:hypothetical protein
MFKNTRKRAMRRGWPILGYVGPNGSGKSAGMVWDTMPSLEAGRRVLSTVRLLDFQNPRECEGCDDLGHVRPVFAPALGPVPYEGGVYPRAIVGETIHAAAHPLYDPFTDWQQLLDAENCDVLMDEVTGVGSSRESQSMPAPVANKLVQLRRADVVVRWSAPAWARADKIIRECSQAVVFSQGYMPKASGDEDRMWRNRRMFKWATYDAADFEEFTAGKREQLGAMQTDWHWGPGSPVFGAYDTYDAVSSIGSVTDTGSCYRCGGTRRRPKCSCPDQHDVEHESDDVGAGSPRSGVRPSRTSSAPLRIAAKN